MKVKWIIFSIITLFVSFIYFLSTAPTVVFWDVGEFLASSYNLGIPHPPGTPLYVLLAKFFSMLPIPLKEIKEFLQGYEANQIVLRITLIPILTGGLMAGFFYLIVVDSVSLFKNKDYENIWVHIVGIFVALTQAFTYSQWFNSIEAETYTPSLVSNVMAVYFVLIWLKNREKAGSIKWLILAAYILAVATGIQAISLFGFIGIFLFLAIFQRKYIWDDYFWGVLATILGIFVIWFNSYNVLQYINYENSLINFQKFSNQVNIITYNPELIYNEMSKITRNIFIYNIMLLIAYISMIWTMHKFRKLNFSNTLTILIVLLMIISIFFHFAHGSVISLIIASSSGLLAISLFFIYTQLYKNWKGVALIVILLAIVCEFWLLSRAHYLTHNPIVRINEGDPSNWYAFMDMLTRKQYGPPNPFERRIPIFEQFQVLGIYTSWQFTSIPYITTEQSLPILYIILILMIFGFILIFSENRTLFWLYLFGLVGAVVGLFIYQNPADAPSLPVNPSNITPDPITGQVKMEVRDREYFYILLYSTIIFYGGFGLLEVARILKKSLKLSIIPTIVITIFTVWVVYNMINHNWKYNDRHKNYIAEDFSYNILSSPIKSPNGAVLFTNGDNDTFPVWFMQEVLGYRRDVFNANLSLLNTNWYIKQLKGWGAPISLSNEDIDKLPVFIPTNNGLILLRDLAIRDMIATSVGYKTDEYVSILTEKGIVKIPQIYLEDGDEFIEEVVIGKEFKVPIYFSITCDPDAYRDYKKLFILEGLAWRINNDYTSLSETDEFSKVNLERTTYLLSGNFDPIYYIENYAKKYKLASDSIFRYRSIFDTSVYKDENHQRIYRNYAMVAFQVANMYKIQGNYEKSNRYFEFGNMFLRAITLGDIYVYLQIFNAELEIADNLIKMKKFSEAKNLLNKLKLKISQINDTEFVNYAMTRIEEKLMELDSLANLP